MLVKWLCDDSIMPGPGAVENTLKDSSIRPKDTNDLDRGLGKVRLYADSALSPQHKNREGETQASGVADTANETEARLKRPRIHSYEGKKMGSTVRTFNHRVCWHKAESGEGTKRGTHSGHPTTSPPPTTSRLRIADCTLYADSVSH